MPKSAKKKKEEPTPHEPGDTFPPAKDPIPPQWLPPPTGIGEKLLEAVEFKPLEEKDLFGMKISKRALKHLTPGEIRDLAEVFQAFDKDDTGLLKARELFFALKALGFNASEKVCNDYVQTVTENSETKAIDINKFLDICIEKQGTSRDQYEELLNGFDMFDQDGDGCISIDDLKRVCIEADFHLHDSELREMIQEADLNGNSLIERQEFISVMLRTNLFN